MISTGNDVVSLSAIDITRTKLPNFYSKILSTPESVLYNEAVAAALPFENFVWLLWSIKESAFKYLQRINPELIFTPVMVVGDQLQVPPAYTPATFGKSELSGAGFKNLPTFGTTVTFGQDVIYSKSLVYTDVIVTVVHSNKNFEDTFWGIKWIDDTDNEYQSASVREFLLGNLHKLCGLDHITISKNKNAIPVLLKGTEETDSPVSLSHHGHFVAYSFQHF